MLLRRVECIFETVHVYAGFFGHCLNLIGYNFTGVFYGLLTGSESGQRLFGTPVRNAT
jgi:hypothetical protein